MDQWLISGLTVVLSGLISWGVATAKLKQETSEIERREARAWYRDCISEAKLAERAWWEAITGPTGNRSANDVLQESADSLRNLSAEGQALPVDDDIIAKVDEMEAHFTDAAERTSRRGSSGNLAEIEADIMQLLTELREEAGSNL